MAGSARYHGQGRRRPTLSQRGRSQHAVQRAAAARADRGAAGLRPRTCDGLARAAGKVARWTAVLAAVVLAAIVAIAEFPDQLQKNPGRRSSRNLLPLRWRNRRRSKRRIGSTRTGRSRTGTGSIMQVRAPMTFPVPTTGLSRWNSRDSPESPNPAVQERGLSGTIRFSCRARRPSIPTRRTLQRYGYYASDAKTEPAPATVTGLKLKPTPVENFDGLRSVSAR